MKITLSKSQWQLIGNKAGWIKKAQSAVTQTKKECPRCHGAKSVETKTKDLGTLEYCCHTISCPMCSGKGYIAKEDLDSYYHSMGIIPCPHKTAQLNQEDNIDKQQVIQKQEEIIKQEKLQIAKTILQQLGGNKFVVMTGAKNLTSIGNGLSFRLPGHGFTKNGINYVKIILAPSDTYNIELGKIRGTTYKIINTINDVYFDQLQEIFTRETGLNTHL
jgi:hypothetical protein